MSNKTTLDLPVASAYTVVSSREEEHHGTELPPVCAYATTVVHHDAECINVHRPAGRRISPEVAHLVGQPDATNHTWNDDFFDDEDDGSIVAVFDFDYNAMECHYKTLSWTCLGTTAICLPSFIPLLLLGLVPCYINQNVKWNVRAQHLAVTRDGIVFCHDTRPSCWGVGHSCNVAKRTKTIPFDQISDCVITEAGNATCMLGNPLSTINIDTPSSNRGHVNSPELTIVGLLNPTAFRRVVLAMKRATIYYKANAAVAQASASMTGTSSSATTTTTSLLGNEGGTTSNEQLAVLLREIRDELRQSNQVQAVAAAVVQGTTAPLYSSKQVS